MKTPVAETGKFLTDGKILPKDWKANYIKIGIKETAELGMFLSHQQENKILAMHENERLTGQAYYYFRKTGRVAQ
jgi:hypothetical protein